MSTIDKLLEVFCPNGVEKINLRTISEISDGFAFKKEHFKQVGVLPIIRIGNLESGTVKTGDFFIDNFPANFKKTALINSGEILVAMSGATAGKTSYNNIKAVVNQRIAIIRANVNRVSEGYLKHLLLSKEFYDYCQKLGTSDQINISKSNISDYVCQVPPLEVQNEIVRILDNFTELEAELEAKLEARTKQYEYYRNKLLDFSTGSVGVPRIDKMLAEMCPDGVQKFIIDDVGTIFGGLKGKNKDSFSNGNSKYISYMNVYKNLETNLNINDLVQIEAGENQFQVDLGDIIFTGSSETPDECGISSVICEQPTEDIYVNSFCFSLRPKNNTLYPKFSKHLFRSATMRSQIGKTANGVTRFNVSKKLFKEMEIFIPPIHIQIEIAKILDDFSEYVTSISQGLPAEITARRKQYEYYRNKLLTF